MHCQFIDIFFQSIPSPTRSTLFPYTTLFRSAWHHDSRNSARAWRRMPKDRAASHFQEPPAPIPEVALSVDSNLGSRTLSIRHKDRKSTRLNSSHRCISYAVFCLKKKTNTLNI